MTLFWGVHQFARWDYYWLGLAPREWTSFFGVLTMPFIHGDGWHLFSNALPFIALATLLFLIYPQLALRVLGWGWIATGLWLWAFGQEGLHVGASGIIYMLAAFLVTSGFIRKNKRLLALSLLVTMFYGGLIWGVLPIDPKISWEGHLMGMVSGLVMGIWFRKTKPTQDVEIEEIDKPKVAEEEEYYEWYEEHHSQLHQQHLDELNNTPEGEQLADHQAPQAKPYVFRYRITPVDGQDNN
jgi:membrane associated rhomboid family serine protease